jgi:hypothetical protein
MTKYEHKTKQPEFDAITMNINDFFGKSMNYVSKWQYAIVTESEKKIDNNIIFKQLKYIQKTYVNDGMRFSVKAIRSFKNVIAVKNRFARVMMKKRRVVKTILLISCN